MSVNGKRRIGVVGYGKLGQYLVEAILARPATLELAFVWNRSPDRIPAGLPVLTDLAQCAQFRPDLIIEVSFFLSFSFRQVRSRVLSAGWCGLGGPSRHHD
jgi:predicted dinucleotide-utilizing enzyme